MKYRSVFSLLPLLSLFFACTDAEETSDCSLSLTSGTKVAQCGRADGAVVLAATGGIGQVLYRLDDGSEQSSPTFESLTAGTYTVTARDETGCTAVTSAVIAEGEAELSAVATATASDCSKSVGQISLDVSGGAPPYTYFLNDSLSSDDPEFQRLPPGKYRLSVRDASGCTTEVETAVASGISFSATIKELITTTCAITGCHVAPRVPNFSTEEDIFKYAARIQERTSEGSMPPPDSGRSLTAEQISQIACWVGDGAPDN